MSTPDQPQTPPLTRRQLREIRNTGTTPVLSPEDIAQNVADAERVVEEQPAEEQPAESAADELVQAPVGEPAAELDASEPDAAEPDEPDAVEVAESEAPESEEPEVVETIAEPIEHEHAAAHHGPELGVAPLTRRQVREHERIRTASVPIIAPDAAPMPQGPVESVEAPSAPTVEEELAKDEVIADVPGLVRPAPVAEDPVPAVIVNPHFGSGLLAGEAPAVDLPPSFDQLIARSGSAGVSSSTPNALILSQAPAVAPLVAPVTATGEVLITGTFDLPEGLGSVGHAPGIHDTKDADAVLVDGELPAASSPTPIAASAAISQVRNSDEIIRPPAPEKGGRLTLALIITAGALLVTVTGLLVLVFTTGAL